MVTQRRDILTRFMASLRVEELNRRAAIRFAAALFSWGDIARDTIYHDDDTDGSPE